MADVQQWLSLYRSRNPEIRVRAARHLLTRGPEVPLQVLLEIFDSLSTHGLGAASEQALKHHRDPAVVSEMIARLKSADDFVREVACTILGDAGDKCATSHLLAMHDDRRMMVRRAATFALASLKDPASIQELKRQRDVRCNDDINVRLAIDCALRELGAT